jgi:hypothetical protein
MPVKNSKSFRPILQYALKQSTDADVLIKDELDQSVRHAEHKGVQVPRDIFEQMKVPFDSPGLAIKPNRLFFPEHADFGNLISDVCSLRSVVYFACLCSLRSAVPLNKGGQGVVLR